MSARKKIIITLVLLVVATAAGVFWRAYQSGDFRQALVGRVVQNLVSTPEQVNLVERALGLARPRTYLVLFLNNTELRPGGGFIGAYAVVKMDRAIPSIIKVEGTELLDNYAPQDFPSEPPLPLKKYLKIARWNFRDSNWSPDFSISSAKALELYRKEKGVEADQIDAVLGFTPTMLEEILKIGGPITLSGQEFTSSNFTEKLEYEVEYGYAKQGLGFNERKKTLVDLTHALSERLRLDVFKHWSDYSKLLSRMLREKQLVAYSTHADEQAIIEAKDWGGTSLKSAGDYLQWVDANLGALKTDASLERELAYSFVPSSSSTYEATVVMRYSHRGKFDWRTSRYRDYARVFVPVGSKLLRVTGAMETDRSAKPGQADQGEENGRAWFGAFISIEPGSVGELSFRYELPAPTVEKIKSRRERDPAVAGQNSYNLLVQKQIGAVAPRLTLRLDFGKPLVAAHPGESASQLWGDQVYDYQTDLRVDREFIVKIKD